MSGVGFIVVPDREVRDEMGRHRPKTRHHPSLHLGGWNRVRMGNSLPDRHIHPEIAGLTPNL